MPDLEIRNAINVRYNKQLSFIQNRRYWHLNVSANELLLLQFQLERNLAFLNAVKFKFCASS